MSVIITESEVKMQQLAKEVETLKKMNRIKEEATYTHLTSVIKTILVLWFATIFVFVGGIVWYFSQFDIVVESETTTVETGEGNANYIKGEGNEISNAENN